MKTLIDFTPENSQTSDPDRNLYHIFEDEDLAALWAAYAAGRPLLVRGKPGTGKSQMAKAIAHHLGWGFVSQVIRGDTELSELHYCFDAVARLGEAQVQGNEGVDRTKLDAVNYLSPGPFWWTYDWESALRQHRNCLTKMKPQPYSPKGQVADNTGSIPPGVVLLIDEIDKANPDLPNGLLETIGERMFSVPYLPETGGQEQNHPNNPIESGSLPFLIVITTNEERELPAAFIRRCFVHTLQMNEDPDPSIREKWLVDRGRFRFAKKISEPAYRKAAALLWTDRVENERNKRYPPGLAEYIDLLTVLEQVAFDDQAAFMDIIAGYAFKKELTV